MRRLLRPIRTTNFFSFAAADWTDLPTDAIITGISVVLRHTIGTAARVSSISH